MLPATDLSGGGQSADNPEVAIAPDGTATVVWTRSNGINLIAQASTRPPGGSFGPPQDLSAAGRSAYDPDVAIAPDGTATVVWARFDGTNNVIQAATRPPNGSFGSPVDLSAAGQSAAYPQVAAGPDGTTTVAWNRFNGTGFVTQVSTRPPGGSFGLPVNLSTASVSDSAFDPELAFSPDGTTTVIWSRGNGLTRDVIQASTRPPGGDFAPPVDLSASNLHARLPQIGVAPDGTTTVVWYQFDGSNYVVQASTRRPDQGFALPVDLSAPGQSAYSPQIGIAPDGTATVVWYRSNGTSYIVQASTRPAGGSFPVPVDLSAPGQSAFSPQIGIAPDGTATVVWYRSNGTSYIVQASTRIPGGTFSPPVGLSAPGQSAYNLRVVSGRDGSATAVWSRSNGTHVIIQSASTAQPSPVLSVSRSGSGHGRVVSSPAGIDCGATCAANYLSYTRVTLSATPDSGSSFAGWDGGCSGSTPTCEVTMLEAESVNARFALVCTGATLKTGRFKVNRRKGTGTLKARIGTAGTVTLNGSKSVRKSVRKRSRKGTVALRVKARGRAARKLGRTGSVRLKLRITFRPKNGCKARTRTRTVKLVR
ncbi:MAG: hypothetical protein M9938_03625 [Solirubrobacterales bacterium]|nr:hypothetical protein [Solirubrobacterales bacterium]